MISRNPTDYTRERSQDIFKLPRNLKPELHPLEKAREYQRAVNATKLERMFAKPFVAALSGHVDGVYCLAKHPSQLSCIVSGSADGGMPATSARAMWTVALLTLSMVCRRSDKRMPFARGGGDRRARLEPRHAVRCAAARVRGPWFAAACD